MPNSLKKKKPRINFEPKYSNEDQPRFKKTQIRRNNNSEYILQNKDRTKKWKECFYVLSMPGEKASKIISMPSM
jgi:hypothetical protein